MIMKPYYLVLMCATSVFCQNLTNSRISVSGSGVTTIVRDLVDIQLAIENKADTAVSAQQMTSNAVNKVLESLSTYNISNLQTDSISLQPVYNFTSPDFALLGFISSNVISYTSPPSIAGDTLDTAVRSGANRINYIVLKANDTETEKAYESALRAATRNANDKASVILSSLDLCLGTPHSIIVDNVQMPPPTPTIMAIEADSRLRPTIVPGEMDVIANVDITFGMKVCNPPK